MGCTRCTRYIPWPPISRQLAECCEDQGEERDGEAGEEDAWFLNDYTWGVNQ